MAADSQLDSLTKRLSWQASQDDRRSALAALQQLADSGNAEAAFRLGRYFHIESAHRDYTQALFCYNKAIEKRPRMGDEQCGAPVQRRSWGSS
jgi:TPR repeat protein